MCSIDSVQQFFNGTFAPISGCLLSKAHKSRSHDNWGVVTIETVLTRFPNSRFHLDQFQHLGIVNGVSPCYTKTTKCCTSLSGPTVLSGLRHLTVSGSNNNNGTKSIWAAPVIIFLIAIGVTWTVNIRHNQLISLVLNMGGGMSDTSGSLFWALSMES